MTLEFRHMASYLILYSRHHLCEDLLYMASYLILYSRHHLCEDLLYMASYLILYSRHHLCEDLLYMASYLILYSRHHLREDLLHEVILCMGYFTLLHPDNQEKQLEQQQAKLAPPGQTGPSKPNWPLQAKLAPSTARKSQTQVAHQTQKDFEVARKEIILLEACGKS
ncbi:hypothetical protein ACOMHN_031828 [Nucella lapillus]